jgi:hypothetical protein
VAKLFFCHIIHITKNKYGLEGDNGRYNEYEEYRYKFYTLNRIIDTEWILNRVHSFFEEKTNLKVYPKGKNINIHHYTEGDLFARHIDTGFPIKEWNIGIILNDDFAGGDYNLYDSQNNRITIDKKIGNVCIYQSQIPHEITPVITGERWAAAIFIPGIRIFESNFIEPQNII